MAKRSKKKAAKKKPTDAERRLLKQLRRIHDLVIPPAVQAILCPRGSSPALRALHELERQALVGTTLLLARGRCIDTWSRQHILRTVPPMPLHMLQRVLEGAPLLVRGEPQAIAQLSGLPDVDLLLEMLHWYERVTRPPEPPPDPGDDYPGPLANQAFAG